MSSSSLASVSSNKTVVLILAEVPNLKDLLEKNAFCSKNFTFLMINSEMVLKAQNSNGKPPNSDFSRAKILIADPPQLIKAPFFDFFFSISQDFKSKGFHSVEWIQSTFAGIDAVFKAFSNLNIDPKKLKDCPKLTRIGGTTFGPAIFEYVIQHIINHERPPSCTNWANWAGYRMMSDLSIGILGYGCIGQYIVKQLQKAFGVTKLFVLKRSKLPADLEREQLHLSQKEHLENLQRSCANGEEISCQLLDNATAQCNSNNSSLKFFALEDLEDEDFWDCLQSMDYLINILPSTPETRHYLNHKIFKKSIPKSERKNENAQSKLTFINVGRGDVIAENEIVESIEKGYLKSAVLDVFEVEPLPEDSKLWELQKQHKVDITPHNAGVSFASSVVKIFQENAEIYLRISGLSNNNQQKQNSNLNSKDGKEKSPVSPTAATDKNPIPNSTEKLFLNLGSAPTKSPGVSPKNSPKDPNELRYLVDFSKSY